MRTAALVQQRRDIPEPCPPLRFPALRVIEPASEVVNDQRRGARSKPITSALAEHSKRKKPNEVDYDHHQ
jgi:hypothetical protein